MKKYFLSLLLVLQLTDGFSQEKEEDFVIEYNRVLENLSSENWDEANKLSTLLLNKIESDKLLDKEKSVLRYIVIYSNAGLLNEKKISKDEALKRVKGFKETYISMPAHPVIKNCYVNCTHLATEQKNTLFSGVNNAAGTQVFSFEYTKMKEKIDADSIKLLEGKNVALYGKLTEISVEGNFLPRYKLKVEEGEMSIVEE